MSMPFMAMIAKPFICSKADREQAHKKYLMICLFGVILSYIPFILVPYLGPEIYEKHPRACWYTLVVLKILGDITFVSAWTLGDSLAINYAKRTGTEFCVYRVWGTISWMIFGFIIGMINENPMFPKYVPAYLVLTGSCLFDLIVIWLWPAEYFRMVNLTVTEQKKIEEERDQGLRPPALMSKRMVLCHIGKKIQSPFRREINREKRIEAESKLPEICWTTSITKDQQNTQSDSPQIRPSDTSQTHLAKSDKPISKKVQLQILLILARRDYRFSTYLLVFVVLGLSQIGLTFFFLSLEEICRDGTCNFSRLTGMTQISMAAAETVLFIYIKRVKAYLRHTDMCALAFLCAAAKWLFYGTFWRDVDPLFCLVAESMHGINFGLFLTLVVEISHMFASQVADVIPELASRGMIDHETNPEKLKSSLSATMQAIMSSATDGVGRGIGSFLCGVIIEKYSFVTLWLMTGILCSVAFVISLIASVRSRIVSSKGESKSDQNTNKRAPD